MNLEGWKLLGLNYVPDDVGSWLLHNEGEAMLLEIPPTISLEAIKAALKETGSDLKYVTASHLHEDHWDQEWWNYLQEQFPHAEFLTPGTQASFSDMRLFLGSEPVWMVHAPKHSLSDTITIFKGAAMTGDVETGQLASCNDEVDDETKAKSMRFYAGFESRSHYHIHTAMSAHRNSLRQNVDWARLFSF